jgi:tripartite-type tricarboxylate transporter receptor subunit TctC
MNREIVAILNEPDTQQKLAVAYMESVGSTPEELAKWMVEERNRWAPVIKHVGLKAD